MDDKTLTDLKQVVDQALSIKKKIAALDDVLVACNAEAGFLDIKINYRNQNEVSLAAVLGAGETFTAFKKALGEAAGSEKARLHSSYTNLNQQGAEK
jgi:hypothetical protein